MLTSLSRSSEFVGRAEQLAQLAECAVRVDSGSPSLVAVEGVSGIGKTALVQEFVADLDNFLVWRVAGDLAEVDLSYGIIEQLVSRVDPTMAAGTVLASLTPALTPFEVGAALVDLLGRVQSVGPIAMIIDDVQWVDQASLQVLRFVLRRLWADRVLTVLVATTGDIGEVGAWESILTGLDQVVRIRLEGLTVTDIQALADKIETPELNFAMAHRLWERTEGHPLYTKSLLTEVSADTWQSMGDSLPLPDSLMTLVHRQLAALPEPSRRFIEALAVLDARSPLGIVGEVSGVDDPAEALGPLLRAGLVQWWPDEPMTPVQVAHSLQRQAIYQTLGPLRRQQLHIAVAPLVSSSSAWGHRVAACDRPSDELAAELEQAAEQLLASGGDIARVTTLLLWSADLSETLGGRERRVLAAAAQLLMAAELHHKRAIALQPKVETCAPSPLRSAVLGQLALVQGQLSLADTLLGEALEAAWGDPELRLVTSVAVTGLAKLYAWLGTGEESFVLAQKIVEFGSDNPQLAAWPMLLLANGHGFTSGARAGLRSLAETAHLPDDPARVDPAASFLLMVRGTFRMHAGELAAGVHDLATMMRLTSHLAPSEMKEFGHLFVAQGYYLLGKWEQAALNVEDALVIGSVDEHPWVRAPAHMVACWVAAGRGDWSRASVHLQSTKRWAESGGAAVDVLYPSMAEAVFAQAGADHEGMLSALHPLLELPLPTGHPLLEQIWWRPLHVEALIGTGRLDEAGKELTQLTAIAAGAPSLRLITAWLTGQLAEAQDDPATARAIYEQALAAPENPNDPPLHRARLHQAHGGLLRPFGERRAAGENLQQAYNLYAQLGALPFLERCREDLALSGLQMEEDPADDQLLAMTKREREIANLVIKGLSNAEVGKRLYLSVKTIEAHLSHIYIKLGVTRRQQLRDLLTSNMS